MKIREKQIEAENAFNSGCNCAQAVITTFSDLLETDTKQLKAVSSGFGGGMGMQQETCGAVTGAYMVISLYSSMGGVENQIAKDQSAKMIRKFTKRFVDIQETTNCRKLMGVDLNTEEGKKYASEKNLFNSICSNCVITSVGILEEMLGER